MVTSVCAPTVSAAWCAAVHAARAAPGHRLFHLVVTIADPLAEDAETRREVDALLDGPGLQPLHTVANTIMPAQLAGLCASHDELVARYRAMYPRICRFPKNQWGTYFGRLVAYPIGHGKRPAPVDQLGPVIQGLRAARVVATQYETAVATAHEDDQTGPELGVGTVIHHPTRGQRGRGGPCLSHLAFQRDGERVHAVAYYRSHYLIERAYGNYLGLGWLLRYIAERADLGVGELTVVAGFAQLDQALSQTDWALANLTPT
jgi:hypothetical protein